MNLDLNCDLGEGEPSRRTRQLMHRVTSASVACGGHAGDGPTMTRCVRWAGEWNVRLGAHPGADDRRQFGRGPVTLTPAALERLLLEQVGALEAIARAEGVPLRHIKLHGTCYHATEREHRLARRYLDVVAHHWPGLVIYAQARGRVATLARRVAVWGEAFLDRRYRADGMLVPRDEPGAVLGTLREMLDQAGRLLDCGEVIAQDGRRLRLNPRTLCLHSDTPHATRLAAVVGAALGRGKDSGA